MVARPRMPHLSRRRFVQSASALGLGLLAACGGLPAQQPPPRVYRIGYLSPQSLAITQTRLDAFQQGLRDLGWIEGQNLTLTLRVADGQADRLPALAADLVQLQPDVLVTNGEIATKAIRDATSTIPIVFATHPDPVGAHVVDSFAHPGGNATGVSEMAPELAGKRVELLKEAIPAVARVGAIYNVGDQTMRREFGETQVGTQTEGLDLLNLGIHTPEDLDRAYQTAVAERLDGVLVIVDPMLSRNRDRLVELSTRSGVPTISGDSTFPAGGGLLAYGPNFARQTQRAAYFVDRILKGARPADLPVEQPTTFDFIINLQTAQTLGLTIPPHVLLQATEIIQ